MIFGTFPVPNTPYQAPPTVLICLYQTPPYHVVKSKYEDYE